MEEIKKTRTDVEAYILILWTGYIHVGLVGIHNNSYD